MSAESSAAPLETTAIPLPSIGRRRHRAWLLQTARFAVVGAGCAVVDLGLFNLLHFLVGIGPLTAKTLAVGVATLASYLGNRLWTFSGQARGRHVRDLPTFAALNGVGLLIALVVLAAVRYGLELTDPLPLNILGNGGGVVLATAFRFWAYRRWVFGRAAGTREQDNVRRIPSRLRKPS